MENEKKIFLDLRAPDPRTGEFLKPYGVATSSIRILDDHCQISKDDIVVVVTASEKAERWKVEINFEPKDSGLVANVSRVIAEDRMFEMEVKDMPEDEPVRITIPTFSLSQDIAYKSSQLLTRIYKTIKDSL